MTYVDRVAAPVAAFVSELRGQDDGDLVRRARQRETIAFEQLYHAHVRRIYALCLRMTADPRRAEDLTQQAFVAAWEKLPFLQSVEAFSGWLRRLAINTVLIEFRTDQRRARRIFGTADPGALETPNTPPPAGSRLDLEQAIASLPAQARAVFVLHDVEGWRHEEIAQQLGVATGTTKAQLHRARKLLQEILR